MPAAIPAAPERLVVVGAGMAAARLVREVEARCPGRFALTLIGAERHAPYDRMALSSLLAGERAADKLALMLADDLERLDVRLGTPVAAVDRDARTVRLADDTEVLYDRLVLATGSQAVRLPLPGGDLPGVLTFRDLADVEKLSAAQGPAVVIGGGLLGLEAAYGLRRRGLEVTLIHLMPWLMERQLDRAAGAVLKERIEGIGIRVLLEASTAAITGDGRVDAVRLVDGRELPAGLVAMAVGVRPETALARAAGLACNRGILVDDALATSDPRISAIGECAEHRGQVYGLVGPAYEHAEALARHLTGGPEPALGYAGSTVFTSLKVSGVPVFSAGEVADEAPGEPLVFRDVGRGVYKRLLLRDGRLAGAVLVGDVADGAWYAELIREGRDILSMRSLLAFGRAFAEPSTDLGMAA